MAFAAALGPGSPRLITAIAPVRLVVHYQAVSRIPFNLNRRTTALAGLAALAVLLAGTVVVVLLSDEPYLDSEDAFPEGIIVQHDQRPEIVFPERVRTYDLSLNRFVDRFVRVCTQAKYSDFRLMLSRRAGDPIVASRFESMFNALRQVRILSLDKAPDVPGLDGPVYIMSVEYDLEPNVVRRGENTEQRRIAILKEDGEWRLGPVPRDLLALLERTHPTASQPTTQPAIPETRDPPSSNNQGDAEEAPKAAANTPARIDS